MKSIIFWLSLVFCSAWQKSHASHLVDFIWDQNPDPSLVQFLSEHPAPEVSVLFWNIEDGRENNLPNGTTPFLDHNIVQIAESNGRPHIIVLAECGSHSLRTTTGASLNAHYPYYYFFQYNEATNIGICVWSRTRTDEHPLSKPISWIPEGLTTKELLAYQAKWLLIENPDLSYRSAANGATYFRKFITLQFNFDGKLLHLLPVHLVQPWTKVMLEWPNWLGKALVLKELAVGKDNPLYHQVDFFRKLFDIHMSPFLGSDGVMMIGDFNAPTDSLPYLLAKKSLTDAFSGIELFRPTFPSKSAKIQHGYSVKIDHSFVNSRIDVLAAKTFPLSGSDHLPIGVRFKIK